MAMVDSITLGNLCILEVDADPTVSAVSGNIGDIAYLGLSASERMMWLKVGPADTDWKTVADFDSFSPRDKIQTIQFGRNGNPLNNTWLRVSDGINSNQAPYIIPFNCRLVGLTYSNRNDDSDLNIEIYKNSIVSEEFTWELRDARNAWITSFPSEVTYQQGDRIAIRITDQGNNNRDVFVSMTFIMTDDNTGAGGNQELNGGGSPTTNQITGL